MTKLRNIYITFVLVIHSFYLIGVNGEEFVCGNIDIRNTVLHFSKLERCTVVEGFVQIVLIDNGTPKDYENLTFPALREITDYLLLFRACGLPSLGKLFPNLSVIRGRILFHDFALVVYEMLQLQQLALKSLTDIVRGAVRIEKNPHLCFVETIDWNRIAKAAKNSHFIHGNKPRQQCPTCGTECAVESARTSDGKIIGDTNGRLCWNSQYCQKKCSDECERKNLTCSENGKCCDEYCLGGCSLNSPQNCISCRGFLYNNKCVKKCPPNMYEYLGRRCVSKEQCINISSSVYYKPIYGKCTPDCPEGFSENATYRHSCSRCEGFCPKICPSAQVTNIASAQSLKGCTEINGSLEIYIQSGGGNVIRELEENLQQLEVIRGFLKVARSYPLITLNFLKKLREIQGNPLERQMYSLLVLDNPNLQDLWTYEDNSVEPTKRLDIKSGKIFFHINPKLCYSKIERLETYADMPSHRTPWDEHDVSRHSNGDKVACEVSKLNVTIWGTTSELVGIHFQNFKKQMDDQRSLLGYLIYYRETFYRNVSIFDGRDACSTNVWKVDDFEASGDDDKLSHIIPHLKPYTQYALYIKTYTIASETKGAQSDIIYFKTKPDTPSQPRSITARPQSSGEIIIEWEEPSRPNGEVTHYVVTGTRDAENSDFINQRNYCLEPVYTDASKKIMPDEEPKVDHWVKNSSYSGDSKNEDSEKCCSCKKTSITDDDTEVEKRISFEDYLINSVYVKKINESIARRKREIADKLSQQLIESSTKSQLNLSEPIVASTPLPPHQYFHRIVKNSKQALISNLSHFTEYTIEVRACHDLPPDPTTLSKSNCSLKAMTSVRTLPLGGADDIDENTITITSENSTHTNIVTVKWDEPHSPNGFIISYHIEYKRVASESYKQTSKPECITKSEYLHNKAGWPLVDLHPGNYSLRLRANSLAGWGNWTRPLYFLVAEPTQPNYELLFYIVIPVAAVVSVFFVLLAALLYIKFKKSQDRLDYVSVNPEYISAGLAYEPDPNWEVARDKVQIGKELGQGSFGMVYEGLFSSLKASLKCAVKTVNEHATARERIDFLKEADVMKSFVDCHHVVKLIGIVSVGHPVFVLMEIMSNGDLRSYLRAHRPDDEENPNVKPPSLAQLLQMAIEIADGMAYLSSRKFVHRDLAARNCMVAEDLTVKIGDFGMTRDIYETDYYRKGGKGLLPVRWMAPESLKDGVFTTYSDVWSYGVVLWEMATLASQPYQGLSNEAVLTYVVEGGKMQRPEDCPQRIWDLMFMCWNSRSKSRPNFIELIEILLPDANERFVEVSYYYKQKSQMLKQKSTSTLIHDEVSSPLKQNSYIISNEIDIDCNSDDTDVHFFPLSRTIAVPDSENVENVDTVAQNDEDNSDIDQIDEFSANHNLLKQINSQNNKQLNDNSKGNSVQSSDGSKGSKISSTTSNGSIANGHAVHYKTTMC